MNIRPELIEGLSQEQLTKKTQRPQQAFGDFLGQEVAKAEAANATTQAPPPMVNPLEAPVAVNAVEMVGDSEQSVVGHVETILDKLDDYSAMLSDGTSLKLANSALDDIAEDVSRIKARPELTENGSALGSLVDELETLAVTERIKFNRGDYV